MEHIDLSALLCEFVELVRRESPLQQRDHAWYQRVGTTLGGSEIAVLMGRDTYRTPRSLAQTKLELLDGQRSRGGAACWWGTLFEDVIEAYVETDLGSAVEGDDICLTGGPGYRTSPDGYIVARVCESGARLWTTDSPEPPGPQVILLLEFKCPFSRKPNGAVPRNYLPQVWSGLALSPVARFGLFVDAVFRKCALGDLGDSPGYDTDYHRRDAGAWSLPVAWGLIGVYAPRLDAPLGVRRGWRGDEWQPGDPVDIDFALAAWEMSRADLLDLGTAETALFERALDLIDSKGLPVTRLPPCFADGRGASLRGAPEVEAAVDGLSRAAPAHCRLFAVLPWKLFEVDYVPVLRRPGFLDEVLPLVESFHARVAEARTSEDPAEYLRTHLAGRDSPRPSAGWVPSEADVQNLFDEIGG